VFAWIRMNLLKYASGIFCAIGVESDMLHQSKTVSNERFFFGQWLRAVKYAKISISKKVLAFRGSLIDNAANIR